MSTADFDTMSRILAQRWTCRRFRPDPVDHAEIERLLALAQRTPSWCNTQPWQVVVTEGAATDRFRVALLDHIADTATEPDFDFPAAYTGVYRDRRKECGLALYQSVGIAKGDHTGALRQLTRNFELFDAPHVAIVTTDADLGVYGAIDCGLYLNSFLLGAHSLGIATAPQAALASYSPFLRSYFNLPEHRRVVFGISFGHPDTDDPVNSFRTTRADLAETVRWAR